MNLTAPAGDQPRETGFRGTLRRLTIAAALLALIGAAAPALAQSSLQKDATTCTTETSPADAAISACNWLIATRKLSPAMVGTIHFWRAVAYNKKGDYVRVIEDATASLKIDPSQVALYNLRGSAYYDRGEYDIAIADFNDAIRIGLPHQTILHNRGNAYRSKGDYTRAIADYDKAIALSPRDMPFSYQNRGASKQALGDLDGALTDINEAIRSNPKMPSAYINRSTLWRIKGEYDRAIADDDEAIRLAKSGITAPTLTPPGSWLINAHVTRGLAYEAKGDLAHARSDFNTALAMTAVDAGSKSSLATAKARLAVIAGADSAPVPPPAGDGARRIALVIGNGAYAAVSHLPNPPNDARTVAKGLRAIGFDVSEGIDLDRAAMEKLLREFMRSALTARTAVVFYAGHGVQINGQNYLLPIDIKTDTVSDLISGMTDVDTLLAGLDGQIRTNIIILDACRDNPLSKATEAANSGRSIQVRSGLAAPGALGAGATAGAGTLLAFATAPGQVALDGDGSSANSPFTTALVRHLATPGLEVQQMLTRVRAEVVASTNNKQVPWSNSSLLGEVFLAGKQ
ncbi:MAG: caspase family protein [Alphaproteobacteria bacterium]|nr:caspase family protein [Alphaproteobacteria bacterium]